MTTVTHPHSEQQPGPYATAAARYLANGWAPLPLPHGKKGPVPTGWTGNDGAWPSGADVWAWTEDHPDGNIALRLPPTVLGIDVDHYGDKPGGLVLHKLEQQLGDLPPTWRSTSRDDGVSGIRLYRIPEGRRWPGVLGPGIETIRHAHRYTVAWPSTHPNGGTYRWINPDNLDSLDVPHVDDLPDLPAAWLEHFAPDAATDQARAGLAPTAASTWLTERGTGHLCAHMDRALTGGLDALASGAGARHDAALQVTNRITWLTGQGHTGGTAALDTFGGAFLAAVAGDRAEGEARAELARMINGAIDLAAAQHPTPQPDPCVDPFAGLIPKEQPWTAPTNNLQPPQPTPSNESPTPSNSSSSSSNERPTTASDPTATTGATPTPTPDPEAVPAEQERTTWWPQTLATATGDTDPEPPPTHLTRTDGHSAFYAGRVNGLIGPSESGKTWVALHAVHQAITAGQSVTYLDFEDSERGIVGRLLALGAHPQQLLDRFAYVGPDEPFHPLLPTGLDLREHLDTHRPDVIVVDGYNAAMTLQGLNLQDNKDVTQFMQQVVKPLARDGATVIYVDHVQKDTESTAKGGIGAQAKRAMTTGCTLRVDAIKPFGKGQDGKLRIHIDKDRQGDVRGVSAPGKTTHWFGDFTLTHAGDGQVTAELTAPEGFDPTNPTAAPEFRPTGLMAKVSTYLETHPGAGVREIRDAGLGRKEYVAKALDVLVAEGWVRIEKGARSKSEHYLDTTFDELLPPPNDRAPDCAPTVLPEHAQATVPPCSHGPDVVRPERGTVAADDGHASSERAPGAHKIVERVIAGQRVHVDPDTGEVLG